MGRGSAAPLRGERGILGGIQDAGLKARRYKAKSDPSVLKSVGRGGE